MRAGVTMRDPSTVYLDARSTLAEDVTLEPNVILRGATSIGEGTRHRRRLADRRQRRSASGCRGLGERRRASEVEDGADDRAVQPPPARARTSAADAEIGNFAELKNSAPRGAASSSTT